MGDEKMAIWKTLGKGIGAATGGVIGGSINVIGELTGSKFLSEVGEGINSSSKFMGEQLGNATQGVWDIGEGFIKKEDKKIDQGLNNLGEGFSNTGKAVFGTVKHVVKHTGDLGAGLIDDDPARWKNGARELSKTAVIGFLGVSVLDVAGVVDINGNTDAGTPEVADKTIENPNSHHVDAHYVEGHWREGQWIDGYWRDGDGNTSISTSSGYEQTNPDYKSKS
jgi:hypothetical protein